MQASNPQFNEMEIIENSRNLNVIFERRAPKFTISDCSNPEGEKNLAEIIEKYIKTGGTLEKKFIQDVFISALNRCDNPSFYGATVDDNPVIKLLIDKINLDIDLDSPQGEKLIHLASRLGKTKIFEALIDRGLDINELTQKGKTPLHLAIELEREEIFEYLIKKNANLEIKSEGGITPLHLASESCRLSLVKKLIDAGADINAKTLEGDTPLHLALKIGQSSDNNEEYRNYSFSMRDKMVKLLLKMGANQHETNNDGISASTIIINLQTQKSELIFGASEAPPTSLEARRLLDSVESVVVSPKKQRT